MALGKITHTPEGLADILCDECELKFKIEQSTREIFKTYGYKMVQTPTFEYYDVYDISTPTKAENMFKFFDTNGRMLALRPDFTTSIARMAATKPIGNELPLKLSYSGSAFRNEENFSQARQREFTQLGVEFMGDARPEADAEIIEIAINTLLKAGIKQFQIDIGQVEFFKGLVEDAGLDIAQVDTFRELIDGKDFIGIENVLDEYNLNSHLRDIFLNLPTMFGDIDIVEDVLKNNDLNDRSSKALENLLSVYNILKSRGLDKYISIDLGMVPNLDYYTGIIIKGFTYGVGFPICTGGRYDNLTEKFGRNMPATGVAIGIERVMAALTDENCDKGKNINSSEYVTIALAKGRLAELSVDIFEKIGFNVSEIKEKSRKLIFTDEKNKVKFILVKASDVPTYVEYGAADIGIVG
ncbi:MAG: ATP phosphoribosyltransferase regulatory subunit, partial [Oscillospiraceae bacterium]